MRLHHGGQAARDFCVRLVPSGLLEDTVAFDQWRAQPVRVFMQVFQRHAFGADVASTEHVGVVAANADDLAVAHLDLQTAAGLAQGADAVVGGVGRGVGHACLAWIAARSSGRNGLYRELEAGVVF